MNKKQEINRIAFMESLVNCNEANPYVIGGAEFNVGQEINCWDKLCDLRWNLIGMHRTFVDRENTTLAELHEMYENAAVRHKSFAHIERGLHKIDHGRHGDKLTWR